MPHILISYKDNPYPSFSVNTTSLGRSCETLKHKSWIGFDNRGNELGYVNAGSSHILIQDCSFDEFMSVISYEPIKFRVVFDVELSRTNRMLDCPSLKLNLESVLERDAVDLPITSKPEVVPSL